MVILLCKHDFRRKIKWYFRKPHARVVDQCVRCGYIDDRKGWDY